MSRRVIGITTGGRSEGYITSRHYDAFFSVPAPYVDAVRRAGGVPLLIPPVEDEWAQIIPLLDGVVVTGGTDIDPAEYDGDLRNPHILPVDKERDRSELALVRRLLYRKKDAAAVHLPRHANAECGRGRVLVRAHPRYSR